MLGFEGRTRVWAASLVPRSVAMKLTGHLTESIYRRYAVGSPADLDAGVERLTRLNAALGEKTGETLPAEQT